ncbi:MAG: hypothetical protein BWY77_01517 [bacterium ADurb.Bin431]|nr:MAG: hypothetical protein BWY77_01517 [bacterium ADurb.Bin431]
MVAVTKGAVAQQIFGIAVDIEVEQTISRGIEADGVGEHLFAGADRLTAVAHQAVLLLGDEDQKGAAVAEGDGVSGSKEDAAQWGRFDGKAAGAAAGGKINRDHAAVGCSDCSQPQLGLHFADPALTDPEHGCPDSPAGSDSCRPARGGGRRRRILPRVDLLKNIALIHQKNKPFHRHGEARLWGGPTLTCFFPFALVHWTVETAGIELEAGSWPNPFRH